MCIARLIDPGRYPNREGRGWKVVRPSSESQYLPLFYHRPGYYDEWLATSSAEGWLLPTHFLRATAWTEDNEPYPPGYHLFTTKQAAQDYCLFLPCGLVHGVVVCVDWEEQLAIGKWTYRNEPHTVVVARRQKVFRPTPEDQITGSPHELDNIATN